MKSGIPIEALSEISAYHISLCKLIIPGTQYIQLNKETQQLFRAEIGTASYIAEFPVEEEYSVLECIIAFCEISLVVGNPKYEVGEQTELICNLFKLVKSSRHFSILIEIQYPHCKEKFHDILTFEELSQSGGVYCFQLMGDKSMFQVVD